MKLVFTPDWFLGKDVLIDSFSFIVLAIFFILCLRSYKLNKKKNFLYLGFGFLLIALAQLATIFTKLVLYYDTTIAQQIGQIVITYHFVKSVDIFYELGFFFNRLLTLLGFYFLYKINLKKKVEWGFFPSFVIFNCNFLVQLGGILLYFPPRCISADFDDNQELLSDIQEK